MVLISEFTESVDEKPLKVVAHDDDDDDEVVLYHLNRGSSQYTAVSALPHQDAMPDGAIRPSSRLETMRRSDVALQRRRQDRDGSVSKAEVELSFHSARKTEHKLSRVALGDRDVSHGITSAKATELLKKYGPNELDEKKKPKWKVLLEQFTGPMPIGIWIAIVIESGLQSWLDVVILLILQFLNGALGFFEANKADKAVAALKASLKPHAQVKRDGVWSVIDARELVPGDCVMLSAGTAVPADVFINDQTVSIDQSSLTGESLPVKKVRGDQANMGSTVARGEAEATVYATGMSTLYGKTAALLRIGSDGLGDLDQLILGIVLKLLIISVVLCSITLIYLLASGQDFRHSISFTVVLLVASIPIAIEVVVTATLALGSRELSAHNAIVAHLSAIERLAGMSVLCSDKTGTLTLNQMVIQEECPVLRPDVNRDALLLNAALATKWNEPPKDALDTMILNVANITECNQYTQLSYIPFDPDIRRTESRIMGPNGDTFTVMKGAPNALLELCADRERVGDAVESAVLDLASRGVRSLATARTNAKGEMNFLGLLAFLDPPRPDAKATIQLAASFGIRVKMITGDHLLVAQETAKALDLGRANIVPCTAENLPLIDLQACKGVLPDTLGRDYGDKIMGADGFSQALPEHKFVIIESLKQRGLIVGMTGDGVNDAPALKCSHVGVAVQGATDAARAAADIVLTSPGLNAIVQAIVISRRIFSRMNAFLIYRVAATVQLLVFFFIGVMFISPSSYHDDFPRFWSMPVVALITITVFNDGTIISIAYDHVRPSKKPMRWNLNELWSLSICLGSVACVSSLVMLHFALDSGSPNSLFSWFGLPVLTFGQVITAMYLKVSLSDFLTLFSARTGKRFCTSFRPSMVLVGAAVIAVALSTVMALYWPFTNEIEEDSGDPLPGTVCVFIWIYCLIWLVIQDVVKGSSFYLYDYLAKKREKSGKLSSSSEEEGADDMMGVYVKH